MRYDIKNLTLEEKMKLLTGKNYWELETANGKLPSVFLSDGPHGLRMWDREKKETTTATAMPNIVVVANSWDREIAYLDGSTIADDCIEKGADILLAPGVNIKRTPPFADGILNIFLKTRILQVRLLRRISTGYKARESELRSNITVQTTVNTTVFINRAR